MSKEENINLSPTFERCPHDKENPYAQISRELIRDETISFACRGLLIYLLSMKDGWKISAKQIINHCKGQYGRNAVYGLIKEGVEAGYIKIEKFKVGNLLRLKYYVSESSKFKKCFRLPENGDAETGDAQNQPLRKNIEKKEHKESVCYPTDMKEEKKMISVEDVFKEAVLSKKDWDSQEIVEAHKILFDYKGLVRDPLKFIEGTIAKIRLKKKSDFLAKRKENTSCQMKERKLFTECKENLSVVDMKGPLSEKSLLEIMME